MYTGYLKIALICTETIHVHGVISNRRLECNYFLIGQTLLEYITNEYFGTYYYNGWSYNLTQCTLMMVIYPDGKVGVAYVITHLWVLHSPISTAYLVYTIMANSGETDTMAPLERLV